MSDFTIPKTTKNLHRLLNLDMFNYTDICKTSDGFYLGMEAGDCGFNDFIGKPAKPHEGPGKIRMLAHWKTMTCEEKSAVIELALIKGIDLETEFGIPYSEEEK